MSDIITEKYKKQFIEEFSTHVNRAGKDELLKWLEESDFFTAPASTKYHLNVPGGLCRHSINVYERLLRFVENEGYVITSERIESIAIVALLHDICKVNFYVEGTKNQKTYDPDKLSKANPWQIKHDGGGDFIWETVSTYQIDEKFVYGHGEKSVFIIQQFMKLTVDEAQAIRFHMGPYIESDKQNASKCFERNALAFLLHMADGAATFLDESGEEY